MKEWRPLAEQGDADAQSMLGAMYSLGKGVPQDDKVAAKWFEKAAEQGDAGAQNQLGNMYDEGHGVSQSFIRAFMWWDIAASLGNNDAKRKRGIIEEQMTPADVLKAKQLAKECIAKVYKDC